MSEEDVERYLKALAHPVRREVIRALAEKGSLSYTELMRITEVDDSGTFAFHMRMLQGLVCKDPQTGDYKLSEEGVRAYKVLRILSGEQNTEEGVTRKKTREQEKHGSQTVVVSGMITFTLTRAFAEKLYREGKRVLITNVVTLTIEDMPEEVLDSVLEGVNNTIVVKVPKSLQHVVELKSRNVIVIKTEDGIGGVMGTAISNIARALPKSMVATRKPLEQELGEALYRLEVEPPQGEYVLRVRSDSSSTSINMSGREGILIEGQCYNDERPRIKMEDDRVLVSVEECACRIEVPRRTKRILAETEDSSITINALSLSSLKLKSDSSSISVELREQSESSIVVESEDSQVRMKIVYEEFERNSSITVKATDSSVMLEILVPESIGVSATMSRGYGSIQVEGSSYTACQDRDYQSKKGRLHITAENDDGATNIVIKRLGDHSNDHTHEPNDNNVITS